MRELNVTLVGHAPSKVFIITTGGRVDTVVGKGVLWISARTWGRLRWYPQNIVTVATMIYFVGNITSLWLTHQFGGWSGALTVVLTVVVSAYLEVMSWRNRGLSRPLEELSVWDILTARRTAGTRIVAAPVLAISVVTLGVDPSISQSVNSLTLLGWFWALYTVTMGRSGVPPKKVRQWVRLPSLPRLLRPVPVS